MKPLSLLAASALAMASALAGAAADAPAPLQARLTLQADRPGAVINRNIYGQFVEHLGRGVYEGIWVGEQSPIPNTRGIRNDVVAALKRLGVPVVRWPGGCFADIHHWQDGVGPREQRPQATNTSWGDVPETHAFGTHEFMDFIEQIGAAPYVGLNMGTATTAEGKAWMEYMTAPAGTPAGAERKKNGHEQPWSVPFVGVGNESWGCGGNMRAEFYADQFRLYRGFVGGLGRAKPAFIAAGADTDDYHWTETVMARAMRWREHPAPLLYDSARPLMDGLSLHFYTLTANDWKDKGAATGFNEAAWISTLRRALTIDEVIAKHAAIMDRYDPEKKVALIVDEWGTWYNAQPGSPSTLYQQNTLRDALVAGATLNIFHDHADRVKMANIAQMVNVLQAMILTDKEKMLLTPTYHVFEMYKPHQDATRIPLDFTSPQYAYGGASIPALSMSASRDKAGRVHVSIVNLDPHRAASVSARLQGVKATRVSGQVLTADAMDAHNDFGRPDAFAPRAFGNARIRGDELSGEFPPKSVTVLELQ